MARGLWIDDNRNPPLSCPDAYKFIQWDIARTSQEALALIQGHPRYDHMAFDHDLGIVDGAIDETRPVIYWLYRNPEYFPRTANVHSQNSVGAQWLTDAITIDGARAGCTLIPNWWDEKKDTKGISISW